MALKDCIKKMERAGRPVTKLQRKALRKAKDDGLSDADAVRRVALMAHQNIVDIANRARNEGATLAPVAKPVSELFEFQSRALEKNHSRQEEIEGEINNLTEEYKHIVALEGRVGLMRKNANNSPLDYIHLSNDEQVLEAMVQMTFNQQERDEVRDVYGLEGETANELLDNFREIQGKKAKLLSKAGKLYREKGRLEERVAVIFHGTGEQKFYQLDKPNPALTVRHNLTDSNLVFADSIGGLASPSMSVLPEGNAANGFGEITLIGNVDLADPAELPIFDADGYTVRFPEAEYNKAKAADLEAIGRELQMWESIMSEGRGDGWYYVEYYMRDHPNPRLAISKIMDNPAAMAWFLSERYGEDMKPIERDVKPSYRWGWDPELVEFFESVESPEQYQWEDPRRQKILKDAAAVVKKVAIRSLMNRDRDGLPNFTRDEATAIFEQGAYLNRDGGLSETQFRRFRDEAAQKGAREVDQLSTMDMLRARLEQGSRRSEFRAWVEGKVAPVMGEGWLKINGKKEPYTLENIVRKMNASKLRGAEDMQGMMTPGLMRALMAHRFKRLEEMRQRAETHIRPRDEVKALREEAAAKMYEFIAQMPQFYKYTDSSGFVSYHEAEDAVRHAVVKWATQHGLGTADEFMVALHNEGFETDHDNQGIPEWLIDEGMIAAMDWLAVPVPYFEVKARRAVKLEEFSGAVIPSDTSPEARAVLLKRGIPFKEYQVSKVSDLADGGVGVDEVQLRNDAINEFTQQLQNQGERTLFQSEIGFTSGLLTGARTMPRESGTVEEMLGSLKKQPNVKEQELEAVGVYEWMEAQRAAQAAQEGVTGEPYSGKYIITRDALVEFIEQGGVQLEETFYAGNEIERNPIQFIEERAPDAAYEALDDFEYDTAYDEFQTEIWDVRDRDDAYGETFRVWVDKDAGNVSVQNEKGEWLDVPGGMNNQSMANAKQAIEDYIYDNDEGKVPGAKGPTKWTHWTLDEPRKNMGPFADRGPAINHREILLHVPQVGGYHYKLEDLHEVGHPGDDAMMRSEIEEMEDKYWYIDAFGPIDSDAPNAEQRRVQLFQISKRDYPSLREAKKYIVEEKPIEPPVGANFTSHAFPEQNIIAWFRVSDRMGPKGEKIYFIEEVQSDLHQAGLTDGYNYTQEQKSRSKRDLYAAEVKAYKMMERLEEPFFGFDNVEEAVADYRNWRGGEMGSPPSGTVFHNPFEKITKKQKAIMNLVIAAQDKDAVIQLGGPTPNMPWKGDAWAELAMKRIIRQAVEGGYDQIAWTTGKQQLERYNIDEYFSKLEWDPRDEQLVTYDNNGRMIESRKYSLEDLPGVIGAERVLEIKNQMDRKRSHWSIHPVYLSSKQRKDMTGQELAFADATLPEDQQNTGSFSLEMSDSDIVLDDDDTFIDDYSQGWIEENGVAFALMDENGELVRQSGGDYQMWEYYSGAESGLDDFAFGGTDGLPTLTNLEITDEEGSGLRKRYDSLMVNVANRVLKKLDKNSRVKFGGLQMEGGETARGERIERRGGGSLVEGVVDPEAFYVEAWIGEGDPNLKNPTQISPSFDTYLEARDWLDNITAGYANTEHGFEITPEIQAAAMEGMTYFQNKNRGSITFRGQQGAIIRLSQSKDLSTFLHEAAHLYLEMLGDLVEMPNPSKRLVDDYTKILKHLGVNSRREIGTDQHELFARSWEAYLREGVSPTAELQPVFSAVKGWMTRIYEFIEKLLGPGEQLNDEIRGVFDRLVASEESIAQSENMMQYVQLYQTAEEMGISQEAFDVYKLAMQESHQQAVDEESKKMIKAMAWSQQMWWRDEFKKQRAEVRAEAEKMPVYKALALLQNGKLTNGDDAPRAFKLDKADLLARYGKAFLKRIGKKRPYVYAAKGGMDADMAAEIFGFKDANALVEAIIKAPKMEAFIKDEATRRMQALHPDPMNSPEMIDEAIRAVHNNKRRQILGAELRALRNQQKKDAAIVKATEDTAKREDREALEANKGQVPKRVDMASIKAAALAAIGAMKIRDVTPNNYLQAEKKAGRLAFEALERKDYAEAYRQKRAQIMNFEAYRASVKLKTQADRDLKYLKTFDKKAKRTRMGKAGYLEMIEAVLEGIDLRKISLSRVDRERLEGELMKAIDEGEIVTTPEVANTLKRSVGVNWRDMTFEEFAGVRDVLKQLEHHAVTDLKAIINGEEVIVNDSIDAVADGIIAANKQVPIPRRGETGKDAGKRSVREGVGHWLRSGTIARILDKSGFGAVTRNIIVPIRRAYVEKLIPATHKMSQKIAEVYKEHYNNEELSHLNSNSGEHGFEVMGETMSKADILAIALNWGSESNRAALLGGLMVDVMGNELPAYDQAGVAQALAYMDKRDWAFVQDMWDYQGSFWQQLSETEKRRRGIAPKKVEALPFEITTVDGEVIQVAGGFHPLRYDHRHPPKGSASRTEKAATREAEFQDHYHSILTGGHLSTSTRAGSTYDRSKNHGRVVRLSLTTINQNLTEIIRDLSIGDEVHLVNRILHSKRVEQAAKGTNNAEVLQELRLWLSDAAVGELPAQSVLEKGLSWTRVGFTKSKLAFNVYVTALQLTGIFQSMAVIGKKAYAVGFGKFLSNPVGNYKMVMEKSKFMETRYGVLQTWDKDVSDTSAYLQAMFGPTPTRFKQGVEVMGHYYFYPIAKMQSVVDVTTWMGAYEAAMNDETITSEEDAIFYADSAVENSQTSGLFSDRSGIERGTLGTRSRQGQFIRLWTTLISYMLAKGNIAYEKGVTTDFKDPKQVVNFATDMVLLFMIEGIASSLLYDRWPGDEDEDETWVGWTAKVTVDSLLSGIPLVREFSSAKYGSGNTPVGAIVTDSYNLMLQMQQGEADEAMVKAAVKVTGTLLHLPASQPNRAVEAWFKDDAELYEYFLGAKDDKK